MSYLFFILPFLSERMHIQKGNKKGYYLDILPSAKKKSGVRNRRKNRR